MAEKLHCPTPWGDTGRQPAPAMNDAGENGHTCWAKDPSSPAAGASAYYGGVLNPFVIGGALSADSGFFGREDLFAFVRASLNVSRRVPIVIYGQRRIGKSSVLRQLPRHLDADSLCVVYDLQGKASLDLDGVLYGLAREVATVCSLPRPERAQITEETFVDGFLTRALDAIGRAERLVMLFDEFDVVDAPETTGNASGRFLDYMAALVDREPRVGYVFVVGRKTSELSAAFAGSILRNSVSQRLGRFDRDTTECLVRGQAGDTLAFDGSAMDALFEVASGHPYCSQLLCHILWRQQTSGAATLPAPVTGDDVRAAVTQAIEFGTNGLNWIYDGLENPTHRLFLAALAELSGADASTAVTVADIEYQLYEGGTAVDAAQLRGAPTELSRWDVVDAVGEGYRFSVPMIGRWIRANRPLAELQHELQLVNPRAWRHYELGLSKLGQLDDAIGEFWNAVQANPAMVDGWLALGSSLKQRGQAEDVDAAIEAFQRAYDLNRSGPRQSLLDVLTETIAASTHDPVKLIALYKRVIAVEPHGPAAARARRTVLEAASVRLPFGKRLKEADAIFLALGDEEGREQVRRRLEQFRPYERAENIAIVAFLGGIPLAFVNYEWLLGWTQTFTIVGRELSWSHGLRGVMIAVGLSGFVATATLDKESPRRVALSIAIIFVAVATLLWLSGSLVITGVASSVVAVVALGFAVDRVEPELLRGPKAQEKPTGVPRHVAHTVGSALIEYARSRRDAAKASKGPTE